MPSSRSSRVHGPTQARRRSIAGFALASLALPAALQAAPVLGTPQGSVSGQASAGNLASSTACGDSVSGTTLAAFGCTAGNASNGTTVSATAGGGAIHATVLAQGGTSTDTYGGSGQINSSFSDFFAVRGPANTAGVLRGSVVVSGALDVSVSGAGAPPAAPTAGLASYSVQASLAGWNGASDGNVFQATNGLSTSSNGNGGVLLVDAPISFGPDGWSVLSISILAQLHAEGTARAFRECSTCATLPGEFRSEAGFGNTIFWGGITSITVGNTVLDRYDYLASASGVDYRVSTEFVPAPVPEPSTWALLGAGLAALGLARRRRGRAFS